MPRQTGRLNALKVQRTKAKGLLSDGGGLYLQISAAGTKSWVFRYRFQGRTTPRDMGLGAYPDIDLASARQKAQDARKLLADGIDPLDNRRAVEAQERAERAKAMTFRQCGEAFLQAHEGTWRNEKHRYQWRATLEGLAYPVFGSLPVQEVDTSLVLKVLEPIWTTKHETATRLRGRIETILDWAKARGYRSGENPALWRGHLSNILPRISRTRRVVHHPALPYANIGAFMAELRKQNGIAALALEFVILTAARTSEVLGTVWSEIDLANKVWTIPANRIKAGKEHRVPLSPRALAILKEMKTIKRGDFVFPGRSQKSGLSSMSLLMLLRRMEYRELTVHGFRSTFRDWCAECTNYPRDVAEMALAHAIGDKVEAAYRRGDLFEKRRRLMDEWAKYCGTVTKAGEVVPLRKA